jgi:hypothetical protein
LNGQYYRLPVRGWFLGAINPLGADWNPHPGDFTIKWILFVFDSILRCQNPFREFIFMHFGLLKEDYHRFLLK